MPVLGCRTVGTSFVFDLRLVSTQIVKRTAERLLDAVIYWFLNWNCRSSVIIDGIFQRIVSMQFLGRE